MTVGQLLEKERRWRDWSVSDLAQRIGVAPSMVSRWIRGTQPSTASCDRIADALGMDLDYILTLAGHRPDGLDHRDMERETVEAMFNRVKLDEERIAHLRFLAGIWHRSDQESARGRSDARRQRR